MESGDALSPHVQKGVSRRLFLAGLGALAYLTALPRSALAFFLQELQVRTVERGEFRFDPSTGKVKWKASRGDEVYRLVVDGLVERPLSLSYTELRALPMTTQRSDFHCVEGWSVRGIDWQGVRFSEIVQRARPRREARYAVFHALGTTTERPGGLDHYVESLPLEELLDPGKECLLALFMNGKPLSHDHGAPSRVVTPSNLGYKGAKYVTRIEFAKAARPGWWTMANPIYPVNAPVPAERLKG